MEPESHITPETQERYDESLSIIEKEAKNVLEIKHQMKDELFPHFKGIIGVFGSYRYVYSNGKLGSELIDYMAIELAKRNPGFLIITGNMHYFCHKMNNEIEKNRFIQDTLQEFIDNGHISSYGYSEVLSTICNYGLFLMAPSIRSTSLIEEINFCHNFFRNNILGLGVYILEKEDDEDNIKCDCFLISKMNNTDNQCYYVCTKIVKPEVRGCVGTFHDINHAAIEMFVRRDFTVLLATSNLESVPNIFQELKDRVSVS